MRRLSTLLLLAACAAPTQEAPMPSSCSVAFATASGPLATERSQADDPMTVAELFVREARLTHDPGFYSLADQAADCALTRSPGNQDAQWMKAHVAIQFHAFAEAEERAEALSASRGDGRDWMLLGDARMEQGELEAAGQAYDQAIALRPGLPMYDRMGWLAWQRGDLEAAVDWQRMAVSAGTPADPEPLAWALTRLGWLHALQSQPAPEIQHALALLPDHRPARLARGRLRLHAGHPGAADDLRAAGQTVAALVALAEIDPSIDVTTVGHQDPRGYAVWLADRDPEAALVLLEGELNDRHDAVTRMAWAYATHRAGRDGSAVAREALATGTLEPEALFQAGVVLDDPDLLARARAMGPGVLPSRHLGRTR